MELLAQTRIAMWEGGSLWLVEARRFSGETPRTTDFHAHHAIQVVLDLGGTFRLIAEDGASSTRMSAVAADASHRFEAEGRLALLFVEPESRMGRAVAARYFTGGESLADLQPEPELSAAIARLAELGDQPDQALAAAGKELIALMALGERAGVPDYRIRRVIAWAIDHLDQSLSLKEAVPVAGLSSGRLRHLFVEQTGLPFKTYLLWLRLSRAVGVAATGASLTTAAHDAGFSDSPHFSRTFRRMFGVAPAALGIVA